MSHFCFVQLSFLTSFSFCNCQTPEKNILTADYTPEPILIRKEDKEKITQNAFFNEEIIAPVKRGEIVGKIKYYIDGTEIGELPIVSRDEIRKVDFSIMFNKIWNGILYGIL